MKEGSECKELSARWATLAMYSAASFTSAALQNTYVAIMYASADYYQTTPFVITLTMLVAFIAYAVFTGIGGFICERTSLRVSVLIGSIGVAIASLLRFIAAFSPSLLWLVMVGQSVLGAAMPLVTFSTLTQMTSQWFPPTQRSVADAIAFLSNVLGSGVVYLIAPAVVTESDRTSMVILMVGEAIFSCIVALIVLLFFRSKPERAPSLSQAMKYKLVASPVTEPLLPSVSETDPGLQKNDDYPINKNASTNGAPSRSLSASIKEYLHNILACLKEVHFLIVLVGYSFGFGLLAALATVIDEIMTPLGYDADECGYAGLIIMFGGFMGSLASGAALDATHRPVLLLRLLMLAIVPSVVYVTVSLTYGAEGGSGGLGLGNILASLGIHSLCVFALVPVVLESAVEVTYPVPETTSGSVINIGGSGMAAVLVVAMGALRDPQEPHLMSNGVYLWAGCWVLCAVVTWFFNGELKRLAVERGTTSTIGATQPAVVPAERVV